MNAAEKHSSSCTSCVSTRVHVSVNERPEVINSEFWLLIFYKTLTTRARDLAHDEKLQPRNFLKTTKYDEMKE